MIAAGDIDQGAAFRRAAAGHKQAFEVSTKMGTIHCPS